MRVFYSRISMSIGPVFSALSFALDIVQSIQQAVQNYNEQGRVDF